VGVRAPYFARQLNQYCYTQKSNGAAYCTSQAASAPNAAGLVTLTGQGTTLYLPPYSGTKKYHDVMPNIGLSFAPWNNEHVFYVSYADGFSSPRTDNLYSVQILGVQPETTKSYDLGYRYQSPALTASAALWKSDFQNRIVSSFDPDLGVSVDRNVGPVDLYGFDGALGFQVADGFTLYGTASYNHSKVKNNVPFNATVLIPTAGKKLVETPDWTYGARAEYKFGGLTVGLQGKYVDDRFATDVNDQIAPSYTVFDADARYTFQAWGKDTFVQLNAINLTDKDYFGSIATSRFSADTTKLYGQAGPPLYAIGAPRTFQITMNVTF
jgi:iron complex outermembrane receptor protein